MSDISVQGASSPAIIQARQSLARADADVAADKAAHSPSCVVVDQRHADQARAALTQADHAAAQDVSSAVGITAGTVVGAAPGGALFPIYA